MLRSQGMCTSIVYLAEHSWIQSCQPRRQRAFVPERNNCQCHIVQGYEQTITSKESQHCLQSAGSKQQLHSVIEQHIMTSQIDHTLPSTPPLPGYKPITPHPSPLFLTSLMGLYQVRSAEAHYVNLQMDKQLHNALTFGTVHGMVLWKAIHPASVSAQTPSPHTPVDSESIHLQIICPSSCRLA